MRRHPSKFWPLSWSWKNTSVIFSEFKIFCPLTNQSIIISFSHWKCYLLLSYLSLKYSLFHSHISPSFYQFFPSFPFVYKHVQVSFIYIYKYKIKLHIYMRKQILSISSSLSSSCCFSSLFLCLHSLCQCLQYCDFTAVWITSTPSQHFIETVLYKATNALLVAHLMASL